MMKRVLSVCIAALLLVSMLAVMPGREHQASAATVATVKGGWLRLRVAPDFNASVIRSYFTGTQVTITGTSGAWYQVVAPDGLSGYMYGAYLRIGTGPSPSGTTAYVTSTNGKGVRLRSGPGIGYSVIGLYSVGTKVTILSKGVNWYYISVGSQKGYMMAQYLTGKAPVPPSPGPGYTAYVTSTNGKGVRMRSGPSTKDAIIGFYEVGTSVTVMKYGVNWCYIRVGSHSGYMMTKFLTKVAPGYLYVTAVTLTSYLPQVDTVITAKVSPAGATVDYIWYDDNGKTLSNAASLKVTSAMVGTKIRLLVTGKGDYTGSAYSSWTEVIESGPITLTGVKLNNAFPVEGDLLKASVTPKGATATFTWYNSDGDLVGKGDSYYVTKADIGLSLYCVAVGTGNTTGTRNSAITAAVVPYGVGGTGNEEQPGSPETPETPETPEAPEDLATMSDL